MLPAPGRVVLWWMSLTDRRTELWDDWYWLLNEEERGRADAFRFAVDRRQFIAAQGLKRLLLCRYCRRPPATLRFRRRAAGRPELVDMPALRFSLSHTRGLVACALARDQAVGLDMEACDRRVAALEIAQSCFAPGELQLVRQQGTAAFLRLWTLKEAFVKATGEGLTRPLDSCVFALDPPRLEQDPEGQAWQFAQVGPLAGHWGALALRRGRVPLSVEIREQNPGRLALETAALNLEAV
jgi:4'-phosphopantetheinyl transferase